jgi:6,7-dimethyl-8-ribityllumazine synthase
VTHKTFEGKLDGAGLRVALVVGRFNNFFTDKLRDGAIDCLVRHGTPVESISVAYVPGSFEIPPTAARMAKTGRFDAVICLGAIIRGDTPHFDYVAAEAAKGVAQVAMSAAVPVVFGIVTADTLEQAVERSGTKAGNKGWDAAMSALEMISLYKAID